MSHSSVDRPRFGFYVIVVSYFAVSVFLVWGAQRPRLDEAFELLAQRDRGSFAEYTEADIKLLTNVLRDYSGFSRALVGRSSAKFLEPRINGWLSTQHGHLAVRPEKDKPTTVGFESQGSLEDYPATLTISGQGFEKKLKLSSEQPVSVEFTPTEVNKPSLLKFEVTTARSNQPSPTWGLRIVTATSTSRESP